MIITIDGPAGTGKTTIARMVAEKLGYHYFDTGAMYRAVTYEVIKKEVDLEDPIHLDSFLKEFNFDIRTDEKSEKRYLVCDEDVTEVIRTPEVTRFVSQVSAHPAVREALMSIQQEFGKEKNSVFEGRDMGTIVFPNADVKIFLTARPAVRAERRYLEFKANKVSSSEEEVMHELLERDRFDSTREVAPLKQANDAHLIDTSDLTLDQVTDRVLAFIPKKKT